jgi:hypothetical protein
MHYVENFFIISVPLLLVAFVTKEKMLFGLTSKNVDLKPYWILLLLLAAQPTTLRAYTSAPGFMILIAGAVLTVVAYFWMEKVGKLSEIPRIFS